MHEKMIETQYWLRHLVLKQNAKVIQWVTLLNPRSSNMIIPGTKYCMLVFGATRAIKNADCRIVVVEPRQRVGTLYAEKCI